jgi:hypothetical protein
VRTDTGTPARHRHDTGMVERIRWFEMRKWLVIIAIVLGAIAVLVGGRAAYSKWEYPYGWSHSCIIVMNGLLEQYAMENNGRYPAGGIITGGIAQLAL